MHDPDAETNTNLEAIVEPVKGVSVIKPFLVCGTLFPVGETTLEALAIAGIRTDEEINVYVMSDYLIIH